ISIDTTVDILKSNKYIKFNKYNMLIERLGYRKYILNRPKFIFGNGNIQNRVIDGLTKHGSYEQKEIKISYFIDPNITKNTNSIKVIKKFSDELENLSKFMGVTIDRVLTKIKFTDIRIENEDLFEADIRNIVDNYKTTSIFIMEDYNSQKYYTLVKKIFGNRNNIPTQFIELSTLEKYFSSNSESLKQAIILNILLGVYGKSGIQPWVLQKSLNADCFIGLDVSRENRLNTVGIVQVVGRDGKILKSKLLTLPQNGEKINIETIKDIFHEANSSYKKMYGKSPKHIVFHRDGISREEIEVLKETANNLCIKFDYVEITKNVKRRIATLTSQDKGWYTQSGAYYSKNNKAYIITTNPFESLGMAQPIRINKVYGDQSIENIVEDIYKLSFMHIGSVLKARLPVTTHYADLSSTYGNRELIPSNIDSNCIHFI
ncbi:MAG: Piwi domain-containing protein, partial [Romboutsia sp.]